MSLTQLAPPYPIFTDKNGDPLDAGFLYFGEINQNPETHPIAIFFDRELTQPAAQPLRTLNGYVTRNGAPAAVFANSAFSVTVRDKKNALVVYAAEGYGITPGGSVGSAGPESFRDHRPGDAPEYFDLSGGKLTAGLNGKVYRFLGAGEASMKYSMPFETTQSYTLRFGYQRFKDSGDPANDGITGGIDWYNGFGNKIGESLIHSDNTLLVSSLRREFTYSVGFGGGEVFDAYIPSPARYGIAYLRAFGSGHETDLDTLSLERTELPTPIVVSADELVIPADFQWPADTIPTGTQGPTGPTGPEGPQGTSITFLGQVATVDDLPAADNTNNDAFMVEADGDLYVWDGTAWVNVGPIVGPQGPTGPAGLDSSIPVARTFYVTMDGDDADAGTSLSKPLATIGEALAKSAATGLPCAVIVHPGDYVVQPDTVVPTNCTLYGYDLRATKLTLPNGLSQNNMFQLSSGVKVRGFTFTGLQHEAAPNYADVAAGLEAVPEREYFTVGSVLYRKINGAATLPEYDYPPQKGFAFVFKPGAVIIRSPYISDCSMLHNFTQDQMTLPIDRAAGNPLMPRGGGNLLADGSVLAPSSPLRSVVVDSFTAINPNGYGYLMKRNAFVQLVSVFTNWSRYGLWCLDGGQVTVANSNNTFGDFALVATGFRNTIRIPDPVGQPRGVYVATADAITEESATIIEEMYGLLADEFVEVQNFSAENEALTRRDAATLLRQLSDDFRSGQDRGAQFFVKGLFNWNAEYHFDAALLPIFLRSWEIIQARILARCALTSPAEDMLASLITLIKTNVETPPTIPFPSVVEATGQQFSYVGSGVNYNSLPFSQRGTGEAVDPAFANLKLEGGRIYATFSTELGDTYLGDDLRVDFERGTVEGQAFSRGVQNIALPLIQALGA